MNIDRWKLLYLLIFNSGNFHKVVTEFLFASDFSVLSHPSFKIVVFCLLFIFEVSIILHFMFKDLQDAFCWVLCKKTSQLLLDLTFPTSCVFIINMQRVWMKIANYKKRLFENLKEARSLVPKPEFMISFEADEAEENICEARSELLYSACSQTSVSNWSEAKSISGCRPQKDIFQIRWSVTANDSVTRSPAFGKLFKSLTAKAVFHWKIFSRLVLENYLRYLSKNRQVFLLFLIEISMKFSLGWHSRTFSLTSIST